MPTVQLVTHYLIGPCAGGAYHSLCGHSPSLVFIRFDEMYWRDGTDLIQEGIQAPRGVWAIVPLGTMALA